MSRKLISWVACAALVGGFGCSDAANSEGTQSSALETGVAGSDQEPGASESQLDNERPRHHGSRHARGPRHAGGPLRLFQVAFENADLTETQSASLRSALQSAHGQSTGGREQEQPVSQALLRSIASGKLDEASLSAKVNAIADGAAVNANKQADALQLLHRTLSAPQRALVANAAKHKHATKPGAPPHGQRMKSGHGPRGAAGGPGLGFALSRLQLTDDQKHALDQALPSARPNPESFKARAEERTARHNALLKAFVTDSFDARSYIKGDELTSRMREHFTRETALAKALIPILTAEQRSRLAKLADAPRTARGGHGPAGRE